MSRLSRSKFARVLTLGLDGLVALAFPSRCVVCQVDIDRPLAERLRALDLTVFFGPRPTDELLLALSQDPAADMRVRAVRLMFNCTTEECHRQLVAALEDPDPRVRRIACETMALSGL